MTVLHMGIILWQATKQCPLLLLWYREKKWRKLYKTSLSDLAWVPESKRFTLPKDAETRGFFHDTSTLFAQYPFSVFKEIVNLQRLPKGCTAEQEGTTGWICDFQTNQFTFLYGCLPSYLLILWPVQVIHRLYSSLKMSDISFKVFLC